MKKLSKEEVEKMVTSPAGRATTVRAMLMTLEVGEGFKISRKDDWLTNDTPYRVVNYYSKQSKREFKKERTMDGSGWLVTRTK